MPYIISKLPNGKWGKFKKKDDGSKGKIVSHHDSKAKAEAAVRAYYANKHENKIEKLIDIYNHILSEQSQNIQNIPIIYEIIPKDSEDKMPKSLKNLHHEKGKSSLNGFLNYLKIAGVMLYSIISQKDLLELKSGKELAYYLKFLDIKINRA